MAATCERCLAIGLLAGLVAIWGIGLPSSLTCVYSADCMEGPGFSPLCFTCRTCVSFDLRLYECRQICFGDCSEARGCPVSCWVCNWGDYCPSPPYRYFHYETCDSIDGICDPYYQDWWCKY